MSSVQHEPQQRSDNCIVFDLGTKVRPIRMQSSTAKGHKDKGCNGDMYPVPSNINYLNNMFTCVSTTHHNNKYTCMNMHTPQHNSHTCSNNPCNMTQAHLRWRSTNKPSFAGVNAKSPPLVASTKPEMERIPSLSDWGGEPGVARPPRGRAGEPRSWHCWESADTDCAHGRRKTPKFRKRNQRRGLRSEKARDDRKANQRTLKRLCRRIARRDRSHSVTIYPKGQDTPSHTNKKLNFNRNANRNAPCGWTHQKTRREMAKHMLFKPTAILPNNSVLSEVESEENVCAFDENCITHEQTNVIRTSLTHVEELPEIVPEDLDKGRVPLTHWKQNLKLNFVGKFNKMAEWYCVQLNARSLATTEKRNTIDAWANTHKVDIMFFEESKVNSNSVVETDNYIWFFSTAVKNEDREKRDKLKAANMKIPNELRLAITEHRGVAIAIFKGYKGLIEEVLPLGDRLLHIKMRNRNNLHLIAAYAPTSPAETQIKETFYELTKQTINKIPKHEMLVVGGDFNAKIIHLEEEEELIYGKHYLVAPEGTLENTNTNTLENRRLFLDFIRDNDLHICNLNFRKRPEKLITHKPLGTIRSNSSWDYLHFEQMDYFLIRNRWKNANKNTESDVDAPIDSDHYPIWCKLKIKFKKLTKREENKQTQDLELTDEQKTQFNKLFTDNIDPQTASIHISAIDEALDAARKALKNKKQEIRKPWISERTYELILEKHKMEQEADPRVQDKIKQVRASKRQDWKKFTDDLVQNDMDIRDKWLGVKFLKRDRKPKLYEFADKDGKPVTLKEKAEVTADYLASVQWKKNDKIIGEDDPLYYKPPIDPETNKPVKRNLKNAVYELGEITLDELKAFIKRSKRRKACGPDEVPMEFFKYLNDDNLKIILRFFNQSWNEGSFPEDKLKAFVASIYKKGDPKQPGNYRPISLLCSIYKIYAGIIQKRLADAIDNDIAATQFGFRKSRSTSNAIACIRRLLDRAEASKNPLALTFLDWEKAFDRIKQDKLHEALERMNIPQKYLKAIASLYNKPQFAVKMPTGDSSWKTQDSGIRQGCPLSPYLFIIVMTVVMRDVHDGLNLSRGLVDGLDFTELLYADDTALITNNVNAMNRLLAKIEKCAVYHGLNFNKTKCASLNFHLPQKTKYADGTNVPCEESVTYLGAILNRKGNSKKEISQKISQCIVVLQSLQNLWKNPNCPTKFKLQVLDAVLRSKLVYGLESLQLNEGTIKHLNAFQLKGLRKILNMKTTYIDRANTNKKVFEKANSIKNPKGTEGKNIKTYEQYVHAKQNQLLSHIVRTDNSDPMRQCTLAEGTAYPFEVEKRRVGRPKNEWSYNTYEHILQLNLPTPKPIWKANHRFYIDRLEPIIRNKTVKLQ